MENGPSGLTRILKIRVRDGAVVQEAIQGRRRDHRIPKDLIPFTHTVVAGHQQTPVLVAVSNELEEPIGWPWGARVDRPIRRSSGV